MHLAEHYKQVNTENENLVLQLMCRLSRKY